MTEDDEVTPPAWWVNWWQTFQTEQWRNMRRWTWGVGCAAVLSLLVASATWVQQDNLRDDQAATIHLLGLAAAQADEDRRLQAELAAGLAADLEVIVAAIPVDDPLILEGLDSIARIRAYIEDVTGEPLPPTTTTTGG